MRGTLILGRVVETAAHIVSRADRPKPGWRLVDIALVYRLASGRILLLFPFESSLFSDACSLSSFQFHLTLVSHILSGIYPKLFPQYG